MTEELKDLMKPLDPADPEVRESVLSYLEGCEAVNSAEAEQEAARQRSEDLRGRMAPVVMRLLRFPVGTAWLCGNRFLAVVQSGSGKGRRLQICYPVGE